ncbi:helix-turn-helix domain-containing protein [Aquimarina sp. 2201CG1-2-11]|uniref:helix-turn-helix domain-containing protein n=1 Tax=Aquimarina discodermiae TaxID=3231043 RepID=UPI003463121A
MKVILKSCYIKRVVVYVLVIAHGFLCLGPVHAQVKEKQFVSDSIYQMDYKQLYNMIYDTLNSNPTIAKRYAKIYLQKAKDDKDTLEQVRGYRFMETTNGTDYKKGIKYLDSAITIGANLKGKKYPTILYIHKANILDEMANFKESLSNYLVGLDIAKKRGNVGLENVINHNVAVIKRKFGHYEESKLLFKNVVAYNLEQYKKKKISLHKYHHSLTELINVYRLNNQIDSAFVLNEKGIRESKQKGHASYFILNRGVLSCYKKNYLGAIEDINNSLPILLNPKSALVFDPYQIIDAYLHLGKSYHQLSKKEIAFEYYKKIDSIAETTNYVMPETIKAYLALKNYYKDLDDKDQQLVYIDKLLRSDSIINDNYNYLRKKIKKEYDSPRLVAQKEVLIRALEETNQKSYSRFLISVGLLLIISIVAVLNYRKQRLYKKRFQQLIKNESVVVTIEQQNTSETKVPEKKSIGLSQDIVEKVLKEIDEFEKSNDFLATNLTIDILARKLKTNTKYLSKIINFYKEKNFTQYVNGLRIGYIIEKLKDDSKYRNYTIEALATESGFNSAEVFSKTFFKNTGIYPSYFVKQIDKQLDR